MNTEIAPQKIGGFVLSQMGLLGASDRPDPSTPAPAITISQLTGSGAHDIAPRVAAILNRDARSDSVGWKVLDRQLVETVLEELHLPKRLAQYMPEDRRTYIQDVTEELFGLRPPSWVLVPLVVETIQHFVKQGRVIVVGRGANVITSDLETVFHVRLVAPLSKRIDRVRNLEHLSHERASERVSREDRGAQRYVKAHFHTRVDDELLYHLVINTDRVAYGDAAELIVDGARRCFERRTQEQTATPMSG